uniref:CCHC-type domain-containing protein n=1 Tax=Chenopodium quinoa TaxID=63459 RepID=A0A803N338_CHEQI
MEDQLVKAWDNLKLTDEENLVLEGSNSMVDANEPDNRIALCLVGKLLTKKTFNAEAMKRVLKNLWRIDDNVAIRSVDTNLFVFQFFKTEDREKVLDGRPWGFDNQNLLLKEICADEQPSDVCFDTCPFWIRLLDVPFGKRTSRFAREVGDCIGECLEVDESDPIGWEEYMRVKVLVNITKPLRRGLKVAMESGVTKWIGLKYERLGDFCYFCGVIGHNDKDCVEKEKCDDELPLVFQYGPYLTTSPHHPKISAMDREKERKWAENLRLKKRIPRADYSDPLVTRLGPPGAARKLLFSSPGGRNEATPKPPSVALVTVADSGGGKMGDIAAVGNPLNEGIIAPTCSKKMLSKRRRDVMVCMDTSESWGISLPLGKEVWKMSLRAIGIYGWPEQAQKHNTWFLMVSLKSKSNLPCVMFGDLNEIISPSEKEGGVPRSERLMDAFRGAIDNCCLRDLGFKGSIFTWERGSSMTTYVCERLDRFLADDGWVSLFPEYEARNFPIYSSDHAPIMVSVKKREDTVANGKSFRFEPLWLSWEECGEIVDRSWHASLAMDINQKIARCGVELSSWAGKTFGSIKKKIKKAEQKPRELKEGNTSSLVPTPFVDSNMDLRVIDLIDHSSNCWDVEAVNNTFIEEERI